MPQDLTDDKSILDHPAITWTSVDQDLQSHMASLGSNELSILRLLHESNEYW